MQLLTIPGESSRFPFFVLDFQPSIQLVYSTKPLNQGSTHVRESSDVQFSPSLCKIFPTNIVRIPSFFVINFSPLAAKPRHRWLEQKYTNQPVCFIA